MHSTAENEMSILELVEGTPNIVPRGHGWLLVLIAGSRSRRRAEEDCVEMEKIRKLGHEEM